MSNDIKTQGLSGKAIDIQKDAIKRAEERMEVIFKDCNQEYTKKNGMLDSEQERVFFETEIRNSNILTKKEKEIILGERVAKAESASKVKREEKTSDKANELQFKSLLGALANKTETVTLDNIKSLLEEEIFGQLNAKIAAETANLETAEEAEKAAIQERIARLTKVKEEKVAEFKPYFDALDSVKEDMPEYKSYDAIKASSVDLTDKNPLNRAILSDLNQIAKNEMVQDALKDIKTKFLEEAGKESTTYKTNQDVLEAVKSNLNNTKDYEEALKLFKKGYIHDDSKDTIVQVMDKISAEDGINDKSDFKANKLHKKTKQTLKGAEVWDRYMRKADKKDNFGEEYSEYKVDKKSIQANITKTEDEILAVLSGNAAEQKEKLNYLLLAQVELRDNLGQKIVDKNGKPVMYNLIEEIRDDEGNVVSYDMTNLSRLIGQSVGSDETLNIHHRNNAELRVLAPKVNADMMGVTLTDKEIKKLVELSGREIDSNINGTELLKRTGLGLLMGSLLSSGTAVSSFLSLAEGLNKSYSIGLEGNIEDFLSPDQLKEWHKEIEQDGAKITIDQTGSLKLVIKDILANKNAFNFFVPKLLLCEGLKGALIGAALGLIEGLADAEEIPTVDPALIDCGTLERFIEALEGDDELKKYASLYVTLASAYGFVDKDGKLDQDGFRDFIIFNVGGNTIINKEELKAKLMESLPKNELTRGAKAVFGEKPEAKAEKPKDTVDEKPAPKEMQGSKAQGEYDYTVEHDILVVNAKNSNWDNIVAMYDKCIVPPKDAIDKEKYPNCYRRYDKLAVRFIKIAQAINNGKYDLDTLLQLAEKTFADNSYKLDSNNEEVWTYNTLKDVEGIDYDKLVGVMNADWLEEVKVPKKLGECIRVKDTPDKAGKMDTEGAKNAPTGYAKDTEKTHHRKDIYGLQVGDGEIETFDDMQARDKRYAELVKQNQDAGYKVNTVEKLTPQEVEDAYKKKQK